MVTSNCGICGKHVTRGGSVPAKFCSRACAATHRRTWKPVSREWLVQKYIEEGLGTVQIGRLVSRHPKRVYEWLVDLGIPTRDKWRGNVPPKKPFHDPEWLRSQYDAGGNSYSIAQQCGVAPGTIFKYLVKFSIETRTPIESAILAGTMPDLSGKKNGMFGKLGPLSSNWKGGHTPERQAFYNTQEWAEACLAVWKRDNATCQRCGTKKTDETQKYCVHHIVSFAVKRLRADVSNLILLCDKCHRWVHSKANKKSEFIKYDESELQTTLG